MATYDPRWQPERPSDNGEVYEDRFGRRYADPPPIQPLPRRSPAAVRQPESVPSAPIAMAGGRRVTVLLAVLAAVIVGAGTAGAASYFGAARDPGRASFAYPSTKAASSQPGTHSGAGTGTGDAVSLSATGDVVLGNAPTSPPPAGGKGIFDAVLDDLAADLQMANLEQTITEDTGVGKCEPQNAGKSCFAFRTAPGSVQHLKQAGFDLVNLANNHAYDFGPAGYRNTQRTLAGAGIRYTGWPNEVAVAEVKGVKVAVVGFASYYWSNLCSDLGVTARVVTAAADRADLVVVQVHMGAEGADKTRTRNQTEMFLGENRCNPVAFAHAAVDAGADLVVGHGPHVMRGMEFYQGRLIAYSLGNFAGYKTLDHSGVTGIGGVLKVHLRADGSYAGGSLVPTYQVSPGVPKRDPRRQAITHVGGLSKSDFPSTGATIATDGAITPP